MKLKEKTLKENKRIADVTLGVTIVLGILTALIFAVNVNNITTGISIVMIILTIASIVIGLASCYYFALYAKMYTELRSNLLKEVDKKIKLSTGSDNFMLNEIEKNKILVAFHNVYVDYYTLQKEINSEVKKFNEKTGENLVIELL